MYSFSSFFPLSSPFSLSPQTVLVRFFNCSFNFYFYSLDSLRDLWDNIKHLNIWMIGIPEENKRKGSEKIFEEIIVENFSKWVRK